LYERDQRLAVDTVQVCRFENNVRHYKLNEQVIFHTVRENAQHKCWEKVGRNWW